MNLQLELALSFAHAAWRRRWLVVGIAWALSLMSWLVVLLLPNRYEAGARVFVDAQTVLRPMLEGIGVADDSTSQVARVREALLSRPQLEAVARKTDLDRAVRSSSEMDELIRRLQTEITVRSSSTNPEQRGQGRDNLYSITYQHSDRDTSVAVVAALLDAFVEKTLSGKKSGSDDAQAFLAGQIADYEKRLAEAEARLADFKRDNVGMIPGDKGDYFSRLDAEMAGMKQAETNLAIALGRKAELSRQLTSTQPFVPGTSTINPQSGAVQSDLSLRIQETEAKIEDLLLRFTDRHPEVIAMRDTLDELKAREAKELAALAAGGPGTGAIRSLTANPVRQSIQLQLNQVDVDIASLRGALAQHRSEVEKLQRFVNLAPEVEQELSRLNRDYGVTKTQYEALVKRLEQAKVTDRASDAGVVRFDVIDPPRADTQPVWPNRRLMVAASLFVSFAIAIAVAIGLHLLRPTVHSTGILKGVAPLPVLGGVSRFSTVEDQSRNRADRWRLAIAAVTLIVFGASVFIGASRISRLLAPLLA
jgi:polysaccharide chain length determinant protein (PEP-CTERM system associated)